ncbi:MAG: hypothetical protein IPK28_15260 [Devosia sp.]|nr:hypothetical protein [Devosia sp.]
MLSDPAWVERKHAVAGITGVKGRLKVTITGGPRPALGSATLGPLSPQAGPRWLTLCTGRIRARTPSRTIADEFPVSDQALVAIDGDIRALFQAIVGLSVTGHAHALGDISGLIDALAGKAAVDHAHALDDLSDVSGASAAPNGYLLVRSGAGWIPGSPASVIGAHEHAIADIQNLVAALAAKSAAVVPRPSPARSAASRRRWWGWERQQHLRRRQAALDSGHCRSGAEAGRDRLATVSQYLSGAAGKILGTEVWGAAEWVNLRSLSGNVSLNLDSFINGHALATANFTFNAASGSKKQSGTIEVNHAGGPYTASVDTAVFETAGALRLSSVANAKDLIGYQRLRNGKVFLSVLARASA